MASFSREAKILASLNHPNIASIYGLEESSQPPALVLELVEGETLKDFIAKDPLPLEQSLRIALEAAHDRGVVHRDLKPDNIKITPEGTVKVLDFGLAKALEKDEDAGSDATREVSLARTEAGMILGTPSYMSTEQARGGETGTGSDIWAFGCCFYELLTGEKTFSGETVSDTIGAILRDDPDWERLPHDLPMTM